MSEEFDRWADRLRQLAQERGEILRLEEALTGVVQRDRREDRHPGDELRLEGEVEGPLERVELVADGRSRGTRREPCGLVGIEPGPRDAPRADTLESLGESCYGVFHPVRRAAPVGRVVRADEPAEILERRALRGGPDERAGAELLGRPGAEALGFAEARGPGADVVLHTVNAPAQPQKR